MVQSFVSYVVDSHIVLDDCICVVDSLGLSESSSSFPKIVIDKSNSFTNIQIKKNIVNTASRNKVDEVASRDGFIKGGSCWLLGIGKNTKQNSYTVSSQDN